MTTPSFRPSRFDSNSFYLYKFTAYGGIQPEAGYIFKICGDTYFKAEYQFFYIEASETN